MHSPKPNEISIAEYSRNGQNLHGFDAKSDGATDTIPHRFSSITSFQAKRERLKREAMFPEYLIKGDEA